MSDNGVEIQIDEFLIFSALRGDAGLGCLEVVPKLADALFGGLIVVSGQARASQDGSASAS